jgi:hypothetical protein
MNKRFLLGVAFAGALFATGCDSSSENSKAGNKPIVLGDPSTIVTEKDSTYLQDMVADLKPAEALADTTQIPAVDSTAKKADTIAKAEKAPEPEKPKASGLTAAFKEVTVSFPGISGKVAGKQKDLQKSNDATYQLTGGNIDGASLQVSGATVINVSMRYQTGVRIKNNLGTLELDNLSATSGWKAIKGNNSYNIDIPADNKLEGARINQNTIRNAVNKAARQKRLNKKTQQQWQNSVKNVRGPGKPVDVYVRAVMFKIDGKDKAGKSFSKQVRIDL